MTLIRNIQTNSVEYNVQLTNFRALRTYLTPILNFYQELSSNDKTTWRLNDPLIDEFIKACQQVIGGDKIE